MKKSKLIASLIDDSNNIEKHFSKGFSQNIVSFFHPKSVITHGELAYKKFIKKV